MKKNVSEPPVRNGQGSLSGKKVFLTGHTGFKGAWLTLWLSKLGAQVTGYSLDPPSQPSLYGVSNVSELVEKEHREDLVNNEELFRALKAAKPDLVLHLAAQSVVSTGYDDPYRTLMTNVMGTASLLEAVRRLDKECAVLCITSDKCYENVEQVWGYREDDKFGDSDPYGGSKGCAEIVVNFYRSSYFPADKLAEHGVALASARAGNVIGGGDWKRNALLCDAYRCLSSNEPIPLRNPQSFRPWQHVLQCLSGYLAIADKLLSENRADYCSGWNIGPLPGSELSVAEVIRRFIDEWGSGEWVDASTDSQKREANILRLSIDKAIWDLGWKPVWSIDESIRQTAAWYKNYMGDEQTARELCYRQISEYTDAMAEAETGV